MEWQCSQSFCHILGWIDKSNGCHLILGGAIGLCPPSVPGDSHLNGQFSLNMWQQNICAFGLGFSLHSYKENIRVKSPWLCDTMMKIIFRILILMSLMLHKPIENLVLHFVLNCNVRVRIITIEHCNFILFICTWNGYWINFIWQIISKPWPFHIQSI